MQKIGKVAKCHTKDDKELNIKVYGLVFIDSLQFMASSLEKMANNLPNDKFKYISEVFHGKKLYLMKGKGVYPYD